MKPDEFKEQRPLTALFSDLVHETTDLLRKEVALAKSEISEKVTQVKSGVSMIAVGGALLFAALLFYLNAAVAWVASLIPNAPVWAPSLIVAAVVTLIGVIVLIVGRNSLDTKNLAPRRTVDSLRRDAHVVRDPVRDPHVVKEA
jgi:Putative Actinobacterial Holin-X, holin superfamily III